MWVIKSLALSLCLTILLEFLFAFLWRIDKRYFRLVAAVNLLTNPIVVGCHILTRLYFPFALTYVTIVLELLAIVTEGIIYKMRSDMKLPMLFAVCANVFSYSVGVILGYFISYSQVFKFTSS